MPEIAIDKADNLVEELMEERSRDHLSSLPANKQLKYNAPTQEMLRYLRAQNFFMEFKFIIITYILTINFLISRHFSKYSRCAKSSVFKRKNVKMLLR